MNRAVINMTRSNFGDHQGGFTLIEMLISMSMGLMIIGGITMVFMSNSNVSRVISSQTEILGDLYLASHLMQAGLRGSTTETAPVPAFPVDLQANGRFTRNSTTGACTTTTSSVSKPINYPTSFPYYPYWDAGSKTLTYQDIDGNTGIIQYQRPSKTCGNNGDSCIYWLRPDPCVSQFAELIRGMDVKNGLGVTITSKANTGPNAIAVPTIYEVDVTLTAAYDNEQHNTSTLSLSFKTWPRN